MKVTVNRWLGDHWDNENVCSFCSQLATTAEYHPWIRICGTCLNYGLQNIRQTLRKAYGIQPEDTDE